ncbi:MAG: DUF3463 domain-containing protein, partial [Phycisphaerales bacterium]
YNLFGWQKPCYLLQEGYYDTFEELLNDTDWENYGRASGNPKCQQCMVHCGHEPTAVHHTFSTLGGLWGTVKAMMFSRYANPAAQVSLEGEAKKPHDPLARLVDLGFAEDLKDKAGAA